MTPDDLIAALKAATPDQLAAIRLSLVMGDRESERPAPEPASQFAHGLKESSHGQFAGMLAWNPHAKF